MVILVSHQSIFTTFFSIVFYLSIWFWVMYSTSIRTCERLDLITIYGMCIFHFCVHFWTMLTRFVSQFLHSSHSYFTFGFESWSRRYVDNVARLSNNKIINLIHSRARQSFRHHYTNQRENKQFNYANKLLLHLNSHKRPKLWRNKLSMLLTLLF